MYKPVLLILLVGCTFLGAAQHFDTVHVHDEDASHLLDDHLQLDTKTKAHSAKGETLGDYLEDESFIESASYGQGVGRPVIKGMDSYRVGIVQGATVTNDMSAMSQDHAVSVNPRSSQTLELIKGPASLLYGSYSGGVVNIKGEEHNAFMPTKGVHLDSYLSQSSNDLATIAGGTLKVADDGIAFESTVYYKNAHDYYSGNQRIDDSYAKAFQTHNVLSFALDDTHIIKTYANFVANDYGIANDTSLTTSIDMNQIRAGAIWHANMSNSHIEHSATQIEYSAYKHYELEAQSYDGLFAQGQFTLSNMLGIDTNAWHIDVHHALEHSQLQVCHAHGACQEFTDEPRNGTDGSSLTLDANNLAFSHGHPMPDTFTTTLSQGISGRYIINSYDVLNMASRLSLRHIDVDSSNMQQEWLVPSTIDANYYDSRLEGSFSLSSSYTKTFSQALRFKNTLGYIQRLPSTQELYWNGFHHATNTYIFGNRHLDNEHSINIDSELLFEQGKHTAMLSGFYYHFFNYIFQAPTRDNSGTQLRDPTHNTLAYSMAQVGARVYGISAQHAYKTTIDVHTIEIATTIEALQGRTLFDGYIPRMAPFSATAKLNYNYGAHFQSSLSYKRVDESRFLAQNESFTPAYNWVSATLNYSHKLAHSTLGVYLNAQNLTNEVARNHLSFLKDTAPLIGRNITVGMTLKY